MPITDIGTSMSWAEAYRLTECLAEDPSSHVAAAFAGWAYPISLETLAIADLYDTMVAVNTSKNKRPEPWPRPWKQRGSKTRKRMGTPVSITRFERIRERVRTQNRPSEEVKLWQEK